MKSRLLPLFTACCLVFSACSKQAGESGAAQAPKDAGQPVQAAAPAATVLKPNELTVNISRKPGMDQTRALSEPGAENAGGKVMAPQPALVNGQPATAQVPEEVAAQAAARPVRPVPYAATQTPMIRAQARTQAMEQMLRDRRQAATAPAGK